MKKIVRIAEGAYFVPSYSEMTVLTFQPGINTQTLVGSVEEAEPFADEGQRDETESPPIPTPDFL